MLEPAAEGVDVKIDVPYRSAVGSLNFLAVLTLADIAFAVSMVSKFLNRYSLAHWNAVKHIIAYINTTRDFGIVYKSGGSNAALVGYSDADFANDTETRRSIMGYAYFLSNTSVTWTSSRQRLVTLSTTESEYVAASSAAREAAWLKQLLSDLSHPCVSDLKLTLHVDNQSAIKLAMNPVQHQRTKHIDVRYHYIREQVANGELFIEYILSAEQRADIFTKARKY